MEWFEPLTHRSFGLCTACSRDNLYQLLSRKQFAPIFDPPQVGDSRWREPIFLAADAPIFCAMETIFRQGISRDRLRPLVPAIQSACIAQFNDLDAGGQAWLGIVSDGFHFEVTSAKHGPDTFRICAQRFVDASHTDNINNLRFCCASLHDTLNLIRFRAEAMRVPFPRKIWPSLSELDHGAKLLSRRRSPVAEAWIAARRAEAESAAARDEGRMS